MTLFEKIAAGEIPADIVYEDEHCLAFHDIAPAAPVHVLLVPRKVIPRINEGGEANKDLLGHLMAKVPEVAAKLLLQDGYRVVINNGEHGGETVPHLHIHILGGRKLEWPPG